MDYENIHLSFEKQYHILPEPSKLAMLLTDEIKKKGKILLGQAYADWEEYEGVQSALKKQGIDPQYVLSKKTVQKTGEKGFAIVTRKNSSDVALALDASEVLHSREDIDTFVLVSGDRDFIELISKLHKRKKYVILLGVEITTSKDLIESADEFIPIEKLYGITPSPKIDIGLLHEEEEASLEWLIIKIEEMQKSQSFLGLNFLTKKIMPEKLDLISKAIETGILIKYKVDNPAKEGFPTSACKLNEEHPLVKKFLKKT